MPEYVCPQCEERHVYRRRLTHQLSGGSHRYSWREFYCVTSGCGWQSEDAP